MFTKTKHSLGILASLGMALLLGACGGGGGGDGGGNGAPPPSPPPPSPPPPPAPDARCTGARCHRRARLDRESDRRPQPAVDQRPARSARQAPVLQQELGRRPRYCVRVVPSPRARRGRRLVVARRNRSRRSGPRRPREADRSWVTERGPPLAVRVQRRALRQRAFLGLANREHQQGRAPKRKFVS